MSAVDGAFVFDDSAHMYSFFTSEASDALTQGFEEETGVHILGAWNTGARMFTANVPIRSPLTSRARMRFPPSPQFLMNAAAMGAEPVEVAFEELYLALQQGTVDGRRTRSRTSTPSTSMRSRATSACRATRLELEPRHHRRGGWNELSTVQQDALAAAVEEAMVEEPVCAAETEDEISLRGKQTGRWRSWMTSTATPSARWPSRTCEENFTPEQVEVLDAIRSTAE